jgi:PIN domain nuclease of toxin-antitoxin system
VTERAYVLDASALLAVIGGEPGGNRVEEVLGMGAWMSAVSWSECLTRMSDRGFAPDALRDDLRRRGILGPLLSIRAFDARQAETAASLRGQTRSLGLSMGDRACLALGLASERTVLSADRAWRGLPRTFRVEMIR